MPGGGGEAIVMSRPGGARRSSRGAVGRSWTVRGATRATVSVLPALLAVVAASVAPLGRPESKALAAATPRCPASVGSYPLDTAFTIEAPEVGHLDCSYDVPGGDAHLTAGWRVPSTGQGGGYCGLPQAPGDLISDGRDASVSVSGSTSNVPGEFQTAARALLAEVEAVAEPCAGTGHTSSSSSSSTTTTTTTTTTTAPPPTKRLCAEAITLLEGFSAADLQVAGVSVDRTSLRVDGRTLAGDFDDAIRIYDQKFPRSRAYVSWGTPFAGELGALSWLFSYGGAIGGPAARAYVTGTEKKLLERIVRRSERLGSPQQPERLTPGDVFELALELNDGSVNQALLAAHNLLRGAYRNDAVAAPGIQYDNGAYIGRYLMDLRGNGDNGGPWYHLFGTAYAEVVARGDWGPWIAAGGAAAAYTAGMLTGPAALFLGGIAIVWQNESDTSGSTGASRFFNGFEQVVREHYGANKPDPEKFCFNVWGAQIGAKIYEAVPLRGTQGFSDPFSGFAPPSEPTPLIDPAERLRGARFVNGVGSPYAVQWRNGTMEMLLDQGQAPAAARLMGGVPAWVFPVVEDSSWGVAWISPANSGETITLEATVDGAPLHFVRTDAQTGETAFYDATAARAGDRFTISVDPATLAPPMAAPDGTTVSPRLVTLDVAGAAATAAGSTADGTDSGGGYAQLGSGAASGGGGGSSGSGLGVLTLAVAAGVVGGAVAFEVRRSRRRGASGSDTDT